MGGNHSRNKGCRGEREVVKLLQPIVDKVYDGLGLEPPELGRNLVQSRDGGFDISELDWLAVEVKFQEQITLPQWWVQTERQAGELRLPVLIYRKSRMKWRVQTLAHLPVGCSMVNAKVDIDLPTFLEWFELLVSYHARGEA